jgi:hypothetical protein
MDNQNNKPHETLAFKVGIIGKYWSKRPVFSINVDGETKFHGEVKNPSLWTLGVTEDDVVDYIEFTHTVEEGLDHYIEIRLENKDNGNDGDTVVDAEGKIVRDMFITVHSIKVDGVELDQILWRNGVYTPDDPKIAPLTQCTTMGWNGGFRIDFTSPFYSWVLEHI